MATPGGDGNAKLSSLFNKKKKKGGVKSMNANAMAAPPSTAAATAVSASAGAATKSTASVTSPRASSAASRAKSPAQSPSKKADTSASASAASGAPVKTLSELSLGPKDDAEPTKKEFQWAKQPKKYKNTGDGEGVARTWEEQEERNRVAKRINLSSERAFPTLGADAAQVQLSSMQVPRKKKLETKNVWSTLGHSEDEDEDN